MGAQAAGAVVVGLRGEQSELEVDDLFELRRRGRDALRVGGRRVRRLCQQVRRIAWPFTVSRPSHITVLRKPRLVGRQRPAKHRRLRQRAHRSRTDRRPRRSRIPRSSGMARPMRIRPFVSSRLNARRRVRERRHVGALAVRPIVVAEHGIEAARSRRTAAKISAGVIVHAAPVDDS